MRLVKLALVLGAAALIAGPALAQRPQPGGGGRGGFGVEQLLQNKGVQEELKMDKEQIDKVGEALKKVREDNKEDYAKLRDRNTSREERAEIGKKLADANAKALSGILKDAQTKRLKQIQNQQAGLALFTNEENAKTLKLTDEQKEKIKTISDDLQKDMRELFQGGGGREAFQKIAGLRKEAMTNATKLLNDDQKKALEEMTGAPFEIRFEFPGRPGGDKPRVDF
jgi:Spy/CpxP family protein refolding chaperone